MRRLIFWRDPDLDYVIAFRFVARHFLHFFQQIRPLCINLGVLVSYDRHSQPPTLMVSSYNLC
jgi:hypothetical protein